MLEAGVNQDAGKPPIKQQDNKFTTCACIGMLVLHNCCIAQQKLEIAALKAAIKRQKQGQGQKSKAGEQRVGAQAKRQEGRAEA